jgi:hypothetical protein
MLIEARAEYEGGEAASQSMEKKSIELFLPPHLAGAKHGGYYLGSSIGDWKDPCSSILLPSSQRHTNHSIRARMPDRTSFSIGILGGVDQSFCRGLFCLASTSTLKCMKGEVLRTLAFHTR